MNKRLLSVIIIVLLMAAYTPAYALALSEIQLNSSLNQNLDAIIEIQSATNQELDSLNFSISRSSSGSMSQRWPNVQVELVRPEKGNSYLKLTSKESVREPVLKFLLEVSWSEGRIKREYELLINPQF
ncbi:MAG TPA: hypothetical protein VJ981_05905 [Gammaproteobacteria bacterium]|nr:hypothetical protein [Gammaproteobacteria bacterium]